MTVQLLSQQGELPEEGESNGWKCPSLLLAAAAIYYDTGGYIAGDLDK
jgi:hypothetical protein